MNFWPRKISSIEDDANAKVEDNYVTLVFQQFAPDMEAENIPEVDAPAASTQDEPIGEVNVGDENPAALIPESEPVTDRIEVIKAPKVELSGLKVLGKIDLPDTKKKQAETTTRKF